MDLVKLLFPSRYKVGELELKLSELRIENKALLSSAEDYEEKITTLTLDLKSKTMEVRRLKEALYKEVEAVKKPVCEKPAAKKPAPKVPRKPRTKKSNGGDKK